MFSHRLILLFACAVMLFVCGSSEAEKGRLDMTSPMHGSIVVHLKGNLSIGTTLKSGSRPQDEGACELISATIHAGGTEIALDWSKSDKIRKELLWWRLPRHSDFRTVQDEVTGRMIFKPSKELGTNRTIPAGVTDNTPVPVIVVESLKIQLVGPAGKRKGPQHDRERIKSD